MPVPQSAVTPEERLARDERAAADRRMSQRDVPLPSADPNLLLDCADRPDSPDDRL